MSKEIGDSDTYVIYDKDKPLQIVDPHGFFSDVTIKSTTENQVGKIGVSITFAKSMPKSNIFIREWNEARHSSDTKIKDAIEVVESPQSIQTSKDIIPNNLSVQNVSPNPTQEVSTATGNDDITSYIKQWGGYSPDSISDSQLLDHLGIKADHIPSWFMKTTKWIVNGDSSQQEFKDAIKYMSDKGIIK